MKKKNILKLFLMCSVYTYTQNQISIIGCGYVGLAMAAVFADSQDRIICMDTDKDKIIQLQHTILPIYEPELAERLFFSPQSTHIIFTHDINDTKESDIYYICVPTPTDEAGNCNRTYLYSAFKDILNVRSNKPTIICVKSTVNPGTMQELHSYLYTHQMHNIELIYNPEFMREGSALQDICTKNPVILGTHSHHHALEKVTQFYHNILGDNVKFLITNFETAEIIKYAWNSFSAIRIAYVNELADLCNIIHGDITKVIEGIALSEELLPTNILKPGPGYGGSCFPKDTSGFKNLLKAKNFDSSLVQQAIESNKLHKQRLINHIITYFPAHHGTVTILGLSFKANTNDIRSAPSIDIIDALLKHGLSIKAYDPEAISNMKHLFPTIEYCDCPYKAIQNTDCIVALTEWQQIKEIDLAKAAHLCNRKLLIDTRNLYSSDTLKKLGFNFSNMGKL